MSSSAEAAWAVLGDLSRLAAFDPTLVESEQIGGKRDAPVHVTERAGNAWTEHVIERERLRGWVLDADAAALPFPLASWRRSLSLQPSGSHVSIHYVVEYATRWGPVGAARLPRAELSNTVRQTLDAMVHAVRAEQWRHVVTVQSILDRKGSDVETVRPDELVRDVAQRLRRRKIGAVLVLDAADALVGLVSERDITYRMAEHGDLVLANTAEQIMSRNLVTCAPEHDMEFVMLCMTNRRIRHLPVVRGDALLGIISIGDVVRERIAALESQSQTMREYIESREWHIHATAGDAPEPAAQP